MLTIANLPARFSAAITGASLRNSTLATMPISATLPTKVLICSSPYIVAMTGWRARHAPNDLSMVIDFPDRKSAHRSIPACRG
ncbi:hypothetical protein G6F35_018765 [Rhizopus arrhizus]|nr:hypothetical protein G6F35_018765 [Rhizopus arrhizus]